MTRGDPSRVADVQGRQARHILDFYAASGTMTSAGGHATALREAPDAIAALAGIAQGLLLHEHWAPAYGVALSTERRAESHIRPVERMLDQLLARDNRPLAVVRPVGERLVCVCRHFTLLVVALLRAKGMPARARCGFGAYFEPGRYIDHWVCEYWDEAEGRWRLVDAQIDELQRDKLKPDFDLIDVPRDRFLVAGDAWALCRGDQADPAAFGIFDEGGLWFIAQNMIRDLAALNKVEMLPWDVWGAMPRPADALTEDRLARFDRLAALTRAPDAAFAELHEIYESDDGFRVPANVFNAVLQRMETL